MKINLFIEDKKNLLQSEEIENFDGMNLDEIRKIVIRYLNRQNIYDVKYKVCLNTSIKSKQSEIDIIFDKDLTLIRELKLKRIFDND
jgi:hypothetical protein